MRKGNLSRQQAVDLVGELAVLKLDSENCDFSGRQQTDGDTGVEFIASTKCKGVDGDDVTLIAYYYQDQETLDSGLDLDQLDWTVEGYEVI